ncbi:MAG: metallophosphoesterase [Clostridia bacterium]|nr:metallophosphoesterase [Clostridia bacterium]
MKNIFKKVLSLALALTMVFTLAPMSYADPPEDTSTYLVFTSDIHNASNDKSVDRLDGWLNAVAAKEGVSQYEYLGVCGDIASNTDANNYWKNVQTVVDKVNANEHVTQAVYTNGNHDAGSPGNATESVTVWKENYKQIGEAVKDDDYIIYCFGAKTGTQEITEGDIATLSEYLETAPTNIPIFILSHYPLHKFSSRDTKNKEKVIELLNSYPNVIFLWGHNHSEADTHYDKVTRDYIDDTPINFTYAAAGCMCDQEYSGGNSAKIFGKGMTVKIDGSKVTMTYYNLQNVPFGETTIDINATQTETHYKKVDQIQDGHMYVLVNNGKALGRDVNEGYTNTTGYAYSGFNGVDVEISGGYIQSEVTSDIIWTAEGMENGFAFKTPDGDYLSATYNNNGNPKGGYISLADEQHQWQYQNGNLRHVSTDKYLAYDTIQDANQGIQSGNADLFTLRSLGNADKITIYEADSTVAPVAFNYFCVKTNTLEEGDYVFTVGDYGLAKTQGGLVTVFGDVITKGAKMAMLCHVSAVDGGYKITYGEDVIAEKVTQEGDALKTADNKYLAMGDNATFTLSDTSADLGMFKATPNFSIKYVAKDGLGTVSRAADPINARHLKPTGSKATASTGYKFVNWTDEEGNVVSEDANFTPTEVKEATYTANFVEADKVQISYEAADSHGTVNVASEMVAPITGSPYGSTAIANEGYHFVNWTKGSQVVSTDAHFVPTKGNSGIFEAATYKANFEKDPECVIDKAAAVGDGTFRMYFNGKETGTLYDIKYVSNNWTIYDKAQKQYVGFENGKIKYMDNLYLWKYDGGFYTNVTSYKSGKVVNDILELTSYYMTISNGALAVGTKVVDVTLKQHFEFQEHLPEFYEYVDNGDGTHDVVCSVCGEVIRTENHVFDSDDDACKCGAKNNAYVGVIGVNVAVVKKEVTKKFLIFFTRNVTTYDVQIIVKGSNVSKSKVKYSLNGRTWTRGTKYGTILPVERMYVKVTDEIGKVTNWVYDGENTYPVVEDDEY